MEYRNDRVTHFLEFVIGDAERRREFEHIRFVLAVTDEKRKRLMPKHTKQVGKERAVYRAFARANRTAPARCRRAGHKRGTLRTAFEVASPSDKRFSNCKPTSPLARITHERLLAAMC